MYTHPSSLAAAIAAGSNGPPTVPLTNTNPSTQDPLSNPSHHPTTTGKNNTTDPNDRMDTSTAGSIRKVDEITPSPLRVMGFPRAGDLDPEQATLPPMSSDNPFSPDNSTRIQDPPKQARTSTTSRVAKYLLRDLTTIDPPEVKAFYPIFNFTGSTTAPKGTNQSTTTTDTTDTANDVNNNTNNKVIDLTTTANTTHSTTFHSTTSPAENAIAINSTNPPNESSTKPPPTTPSILPKEDDANLKLSHSSTATKDTASKQLDFSMDAEEDFTPLSSVKMRLAPTKKRTSYSSKDSSSSQLKSSLKSSKVVISPNALEIRNYEKGSPAARKDPETTTTIDTTPYVHKHKTIFDLSVKIPKTTKLLQELSTKLVSALSFIQEWADPTAAIISKDSSTKPHITSKLSFPTVIFPLESDYFVFANTTWHYAPKGLQGKVIRFSTIIGSDVEPELIARCKPDLNAMGVGIDIKAHQNIDTNTRITLLGAPNTISKSEAKKLCLQIFESALKIVQSEQPDDAISSTVSIPDFAVILIQPQGLPYVKMDDAVDYNPPSRERRSLHITCASSDFEGFARLTHVAKENDLWRPLFGMCYPTIAPQVDTDPEKLDRYVRMVEIHESVQRCYTNTVISGLTNVDRDFTLRKDDGTTATFSARKLLAHIKVWDPIPERSVPVFLCLLRCNDQRYHAYLPGGNEAIQSYVDEFRKCPGPQLYFYLLKRRFLHGDVSKFIRTVFNLEQQTLCSRAKYNKKTGMAYVHHTRGQMDIIDTALAPESGFTIHTVTQSPALQPMKYNGPNNTAMEYYDFAEGQSITTIKIASKNPRPNNSEASVGIGKSVYEPAGSMAVSTMAPDEMDIDETDDIGEDESGAEFVFDLAALKENNFDLIAAKQHETKPSAEHENECNQPSAAVLPPSTTLPTSMTPADSQAIQEQLTLTLISRTNISDSLQIGDANNDIEVPDVPNFAVVLEDITKKDYSLMLEIIDSITAAIDTNNDDESTINIPDHVNHPLFTTALHEALLADLTGSEESLLDYLECMKMAIDSTVKATAGYLSPSSQEDGMLLDDHQQLMIESAPESEDSAAMLQGCTETMTTLATTEKSVGEVGIEFSSTSRLGADQE